MGSALLQSLLSNAWSVVLIIVFFVGSIFIHELGHFLAARWRGLVIERFSIGFGPKMFAWRRGGVEYRISWLPLGGYVALPQLAELRGIEGEGSGGSSLPPISYADKMIVSVAGAFFNILFALLIATVLWQVGVPKPAAQTTTVVGVVSPVLELPGQDPVPGPALQAGIKVGDRIVAVDGQRVGDWLEMQQTLAAGTGRDQDDGPKAVLTVERDGKELDLTVFPKVAGEDRFRMVGIEPAEPLVVAGLLEGSPAASAGVQPGDRVVALDGETVLSLEQMQAHLLAARDRDVAVTLQRGEQRVTLPIRPRIEKDDASGREVARIGIRLSAFLTIKQDPFTQLAEQVTTLGRILRGLVSPSSDLGLRHMSGPIGIAHGLHNLAQVSFLLVLWFVVLINVNLAVINLLPIPVLDGGHMLFATIGRIRGRDLPLDLVQTVQATFVLLFLGVFVYVSFFDVKRVAREFREEPAAVAPASPPVSPAPAPVETAPAGQP